MSLGVLNNLSALYAENYLSRNNSSLGTVLQQLSSGSRINSGADDAAGLSLVNGLQANRQALAQSQTNALEGVGLLQVADGALSQVTSLLNRAVTLATEASNGTLNSMQGTAANQEYQSILSEISNIGSTTTYNEQQVFGSTTGIATGDSSATGESIDSLNIRSLSSSSVGDTGGVINYAPAVTASNGSSSTNSPVTYTADNQDTTFTDSINNAGDIQISGLQGSNATDILTGSYSFNDGGTDYSYTMGQTYDGTLVNSLATLGSVIQQDDPSLTITEPPLGRAVIRLRQSADTLSSFSENLVDTTAQITKGALSPIGSSDTVTGPLSIDINGNNNVFTLVGGESLANLANGITGITSFWGFTASYDSTTGVMSFLSANAYPTTIDSSGLTDTSAATAPTPAVPATLSYTDHAGEDLSSTNLTNQANARSALTSINTAISNVAAQDGYIGSQINTLNAVGQVLATQLQNVQAAQNAIQATDYASATSAMAKYQILNQTGIAALAQANSIEREVTKLLQQ
jgi:flagellin